ncbi:MAG: cation:proton antiporter [Polyangiaceae bacterium]
MAAPITGVAAEVLAAASRLHAGTPVLTSGGAGIDPLVQDIGFCVLVAGALTVLFEKLRIPTIAALLVAGVSIGPVGLSIVTDQARIETIAHLGLTLLLFVIGLEVNVRNLLASGKTILVSGALQVPLTIGLGLVAFLGLRALGVPGMEGDYGALYLAIACGFSSTLLVVKSLQAKLQLDSLSGRLSVALLIFQDVWAIIVLALQPNFAKPEIKPLLATFAGILVVATVAVVFARRVLPHAFRIVAKMPELVVSVALAWCFGLGMFGAHLGTLLHGIGIHVNVSVSLEMAALIAGASIASFPYSHEVVAKVTNLRDFFVTLFFVALGMGIPIPRSFTVIALAVVLAIVAIVLRYLVFVPLLHSVGTDRRTALITSTRLAQVSEFCLVIAYIGRGLGHVTSDQVSVVIFAFVLTALVTPALFTFSDRSEQVLGAFYGKLGLKAPAPRSSRSDIGGHEDPTIILLGCHRLTSSLLFDLVRAHPDIAEEISIVDFNVSIHPALRAAGFHVHYGDITTRETLVHAHVDKAKVIVSTIPDDLLKGTSNLQLAQTLKKLAPDAKVVVNAVKLSDVDAMYAAGADYVFSWRTETSRGLLPMIEAAINGTFDDFRVDAFEGPFDLRGRKEVFD